MDHLIPGLQPNTNYSIQVRTLGPGNNNSPWSPVLSIHTDAPTTPPPPPTSLTTDFTTSTLSIGWTAPVGTTPNPMDHFEKYRVEFGVGGVTGTYETTQTQLALSFNENKKIGGGTASPTVSIAVFAVDTWGNASTALTGVGTNAAPGAVAGTALAAQPMGYTVSFTKSTEVDYLETRVYAGASPGVTPGAGSLVLSTTDTTTLIPNTTFAPVYVKLAHFDVFGQTGTVSSEFSVTPINPVVTDIVAPSAPSGSVVMEQLSDVASTKGIQGLTTRVRVRWDGGADPDTAGFQLKYGRNVDNLATLNVNANQAVPTTKALTSNVASLTFASHTYKIGDWVKVALSPSDAVFDGLVQVTGVTGTTGLLYAKTNANVTSTATTGRTFQNSVVLDGLTPDVVYNFIVNAYDEQFNLSGFTANYTATPTTTSGMALGAAGAFKLGRDAGGSGNDGLYLDTNNYWYNTGNFSIGNPTTLSRTNPITNPSAELDASGWVGYGGATVVRSATGGGSPTFLVASPDWAGARYTLYGTPNAQGTFSGSARSEVTTSSIWLHARSTTGLSLNAAYSSPTTAAYNRWSTTFYMPAEGVVYLEVNKANTPSGANMYRFDQMMFEYGPTMGSYFDGSTSGYYWSGAAHASSSHSMGGGVKWDGTNFVLDGRLIARSGTFNGNVEIQGGAALFMQGSTGTPGTLNPIGTGQRVVLSSSGIQGFNAANSAVFTLQTGGGEIVANIGGWNFTPLKLSGGSGGTEVGLATLGASSFWAGGTNTAAPFRVSPTGLVYASAANISGSVTGSSIFGGTIQTGQGTTGNGYIILSGVDPTYTFQGYGAWQSAVLSQALSSTGTAFLTTNWGSFSGQTPPYIVKIGSENMIVRSPSYFGWMGGLLRGTGSTASSVATVASSGTTRMIVTSTAHGLGNTNGVTGLASIAVNDTRFDGAGIVVTVTGTTGCTLNYTGITAPGATGPVSETFTAQSIQGGILSIGSSTVATHSSSDAVSQLTASALPKFFLKNTGEVGLTPTLYGANLVGTMGLGWAGTISAGLLFDDGQGAVTLSYGKLKGERKVAGVIQESFKIDAITGQISAVDMRGQELTSTASISVTGAQTTYSKSPDATAKGVAFVAPSSGTVLVLVSASIVGQASAAAVSFQINNGSSIGSGSQVQAGLTENAVTITGAGHVITAANMKVITGLTPGNPYNAFLVHYNNNAATATVTNRRLTVIPQL